MEIDKIVVYDGTYDEMSIFIDKYIQMGFTLISKSYIPSLYKGWFVNTSIAILVREVDE